MNPATPPFEIVTMPIGKGWRVRISDGQRMQFVSGFDAKAKAEECNNSVVGFIRRRPYTSLGIAAGVGLTLGWLLRRRR